MLLMRPTAAPPQPAAVRPPERLADATTDAVSKSESDSLPPHLDDIADVVGAVDDGLPADLSARKKHYLRLWGYGRNRSERVRQQR